MEDDIGFYIRGLEIRNKYQYPLKPSVVWTFVGLVVCVLVYKLSKCIEEGTFE